MTGAAAPAFLRFSRDKRGYEHFYLVQSSTNRRGKTRARILYWFRTPPGVKVGRQPFSAEVQRAIEAQNPGVVFDWKRLLETPIPPPAPDVERWRERRRLEKAERAARRAMQTADTGEETDQAAEVDEPEPREDAQSGDVEMPSVLEEALLVGNGETEASSESSEPATASLAATGEEQSQSVPAAQHSSRRRRRRRRGGHRDRGPGIAEPSSPEASRPPEDVPTSGTPPSSNEGED